MNAQCPLASLGAVLWPRGTRHEPERWRQVEELYHSALEKEPARRAFFLQEACGEDEEMRSEVRSLLEQSGSKTSQ